MSTATKLEYLNTTKTKIKDAINLGNTNITNETFRQYENKIKQAMINTMNDKWEVWNNFNKVVGTNEYLTLTNTEYAPMQVNLKGNTSQFSTTGKNLFNIEQSRNDSHCSSSVSNSKLTQTNSGNYSRTQWKQDNLTINQNYTLSCNYSNNNNSNLRLAIYDSTNQTEKITTDIVSNTSGTLIITFTASETTHYLRLYSNASSTSNGYSVIFSNIQLESGSGVTSYEPYTGRNPAPSPSYPYPVNVVSGDNTIEICGKNLFNSALENAVVASNGLSPTTTRVASNQFIKVKANTQYTISYETSNNVNQINISYFSTNDFPRASETGWQSVSTNESRKYLTFTTSNEYVLFSFRNNNDTTITTTDISNIQLELGTATTYEAYTGNSQLISLGVENLFDKDITPENYVYNNSGVKVSTDDPCINQEVNINFSSIYISFASKTGTPYVRVCEYNSSGTFIKRTLVSANQALTLDSNTRKLIFSVNASSINNFTNLMIEKGSKANSYSEYGKEPIELCKISTYQDYIYKDSDRWYLHKEIGKYVYNNDVVFNAQDENAIGFITPALDIQASLSSSALASISLCNIMQTSLSNYSGLNGTTSAKNIRVNIAKSITPTQQDAKDLFANKSLTIYYVLATPTNTEITDSTLIRQLNNLANVNSYEGQTNITQENNDKPFIITATALQNIL